MSKVYIRYQFGVQVNSGVDGLIPKENDKYKLLRTMMYHIDECDGNRTWSDISIYKEKLQVYNKFPFNKVQ